MSEVPVNRWPGLLQDHDAHPGHSASACPCREVVTAVTRVTSNGYRCHMTGGHCLPGEHCSARVERFEKVYADDLIPESSLWHTK